MTQFDPAELRRQLADAKVARACRAEDPATVTTEDGQRVLLPQDLDLIASLRHEPIDVRLTAALGLLRGAAAELVEAATLAYQRHDPQGPEVIVAIRAVRRSLLVSERLVHPAVPA